jgi:hypothetical protein
MFHGLASIIFALGMFAGGALVSCTDSPPKEPPCAHSP